ncbi:MAG: ATP-binding protein, partial [Spongiibacter sp.]
GIAPEDRRGLLERGKRGDQYGDGQGLGLAIVLDIVDSYGADFRFDASPLGGTRAILRFKNPA